MRLLEYDSTNNIRLTENFSDDSTPHYAILSHTWGKEGTEVTFADLKDGTGIDKAGFEKIRFCGEQARRDRLAYFWVDTCCIDKSNNTELSEAINSMFRWYRNSARCYVYLSDVSGYPTDTEKGVGQKDIEDLRNSKWFTRGWTLQELLAPESVEFFAKHGRRVGDKKSLERHICEATSIPIAALRGAPLSNFQTAERLRWQDRRTTTRKEDKAYSLLGVCGVFMPLLYGEGEEESFRRLRNAINDRLKGRLPSKLLIEKHSH